LRTYSLIPELEILHLLGLCNIYQRQS
jgi:hypothetical protein